MTEPPNLTAYDRSYQATETKVQATQRNSGLTTVSVFLSRP